MKAFITLVMTAVIFGCAQAQTLKPIGKCSFTKFTLLARPCSTKFIQAMIKNPKSDCSTELTTLLNCIAKEAKVCAYAFMSDARIMNLLKRYITKPMMCDKAGIQYPGSMGVSMTLPCNITEQQYTKDINGCSNKTFSMWKSNRADPGICGEYKASKDCVRKVITAKCDYSSIAWFKELIQLYLGNYNPFCGTDVDPTAAPPNKQPGGPKTTKQPGGPKTTKQPDGPTAGSQAIPLKGFIVLFAPAVTIFVL